MQPPRAIPAPGFVNRPPASLGAAGRSSVRPAFRTRPAPVHGAARTDTPPLAPRATAAPGLLMHAPTTHPHARAHHAPPCARPPRSPMQARIVHTHARASRTGGQDGAPAGQNNLHCPAAPSKTASHPIHSDVKWPRRIIDAANIRFRSVTGSARACRHGPSRRGHSSGRAPAGPGDVQCVRNTKFVAGSSRTFDQS